MLITDGRDRPLWETQMTIMDKLGLLTDFEKTILNKARIVFEKKGYYETNIEEIAQSLSIGKGTIYRHFGNKLMLLLLGGAEYFRRLEKCH